MWNLATRACLATIPAHRGFVRGVELAHSGNAIITAGDDKTIKLWPISLDALRHGLPEDIQVSVVGARIDVSRHVAELTRSTSLVPCSQRPLFWASTRSLESAIKESIPYLPLQGQ